MNKIQQTWKAIKQMFTTKHGFEYKEMKKYAKAKNTIKFNITGVKKVSEYAKKYLVSHHFLKSKIIEPLVMLFNTWYGKHLMNKVPKGVHNYIFHAFEKAWNKSKRDYYKFYLEKSKLHGIKGKIITKKMNEDLTCKFYDVLFKMLITLCMMDTSIRERMNMLMIRLYPELKKVFEHRDGQPINHLLYSGTSVADVEYYQIFDKVMYKREVMRHNQEEGE